MIASLSIYLMKIIHMNKNLILNPFIDNQMISLEPVMQNHPLCVLSTQTMPQHHVTKN